MKSFHIYLTEEQYEYIRKQAYKKGISMGEFVKRSIGSATKANGTIGQDKTLKEGESPDVEMVKAKSGDTIGDDGSTQIYHGTWLCKKHDSYSCPCKPPREKK